MVGIHPVSRGLVASYRRPGDHATGAALIMASLGQKRIELLRELVPKASHIAMLVNPDSPNATPEIRDVQAARKPTTFKLRLINATTPAEIDRAFVRGSVQTLGWSVAIHSILVERQKIVN